MRGTEHCWVFQKRPFIGTERRLCLTNGSRVGVMEKAKTKEKHKGAVQEKEERQRTATQSTQYRNNTNTPTTNERQKSLHIPVKKNSNGSGQSITSIIAFSCRTVLEKQVEEENKRERDFL